MPAWTQQPRGGATGTPSIPRGAQDFFLAGDAGVHQALAVLAHGAQAAGPCRRHQFVLGRDIDEAVRLARRREGDGFSYSLSAIVFYKVHYR